jgi:hypothetical protein
MSDAERIAARLSPAQRMALYPGRKGYAYGEKRTIRALCGRGLTTFGFYVAPLTPLGREVRAVLAREARDE